MQRSLAVAVVLLLGVGIDGYDSRSVPGQAEHRRHLRRRPGLRRSRQLRCAECPHASPRRDGRRRAEVDQLLRAAGVLAESSGAAHGTPAGAKRHVRYPSRHRPESVSRQRGRRPARRGGHHRGAAEIRGLSHGDGGQVASGPAAAVPADAPGLRFVVRAAVFARHAHDRAARQRHADRRLLRAEARVLGRGVDARRRRDRATRGSPHPHQALHRRSRAVHQHEQGGAVLPLHGAFPAAHPAGAIGRVCRPQPRRHVR